MDDRGEMRLPLEGFRVLELGYGIAAPVAARNLAQFGADVIRVESARQPDSLRMGGAGWVPPQFDQSVRRDTIPALNFSSPEKRSIGLEIDIPDGRAVFEQLVARVRRLRHQHQRGRPRAAPHHVRRHPCAQARRRLPHPARVRVGRPVPLRTAPGVTTSRRRPASTT